MIDDLYKDHNLNDYPVALTGNLCIGRGISFINNNFMFDYAILSLCSNKQEVSQNAGRLKGNIKNFKNYKVPTIYTTTQFNKIAVESEMKSRKLAEIAFEKINEGELAIIEKKTFNGIVKKGQYDNRKHKIFENLEEAIEYKKMLGSDTRQTENDRAPSTLLDKDGNNPSIDVLLNRWYGINKDVPVRMMPLYCGKYCVYWDSSLIKKE